MNTRALMMATTAGTVLQVGMVVAGHYVPAVASLFAVGGMGFSLVAGVLYAMWAPGQGAGARAAGGAVAGAACGLIGIAVSFLLGDVPASLLAFGTASSAVTGALGGLAGVLVSPS
jgi:hypothetical protein